MHSPEGVMYLNNNYVCHSLQDYWKEFVITAIKSKLCSWKENYIIYSSSFEFMIFGFCLECLVWAKLSKMFRCDLEYLSPSRLYFLEAEAASLFCYITSINATHCLTQAISTLGWARINGMTKCRQEIEEI